jgi:hypothetical protein
MPLWAVGRAGNVDVFFVRAWSGRAFQANQREKRLYASMMWHIVTRALVISHEKSAGGDTQH